MKTCIFCGAELADEESICTSCGLPVEEPAIEEVAADEIAEAEDIEVAEEAAPEDLAEENPEDDAPEIDADEETVEAEAEPKQNRWTGITTLIVIIAAVIVLALIAFLLYKNGTLKKWYDDIRPKTKSVCTIGDYSEIEVLSSAVEVDDDTVDSYLYSILGDDITDDTVKAYSATVSDCDAQTVDEMEEYARDYIYTYYLHNEMMEYLKGITEVTSYDEVMEAKLIEYSAEQLEYASSSYGMDADTIASYYGYDSAEEYETETAHDYQKIVMILDKVMEDKGLSYTEEDLNADIENYLEENGYSAYYTLDSFLEEAGDTWVYLYENLTYKFDIVMTALEPNVVLIDEPAE